MGGEGGGRGNEESGVTGTGLSRPKKDWGCSTVGGVLTSICKVLGSVLSTLEKQAQQHLPAFSRTCETEADVQGYLCFEPSFRLA